MAMHMVEIMAAVNQWQTMLEEVQVTQQRMRLQVTRNIILLTELQKCCELDLIGRCQYMRDELDNDDLVTVMLEIQEKYAKARLLYKRNYLLERMIKREDDFSDIQ